MNAPPNNALQSDAPRLNRGVRTRMAYARRIFYVAVVILALAGSLLFTYGCDGPGCLGFVGSVLMWALAYTVVLGYGLLLLFISAFTNANRVFSAVMAVVGGVAVWLVHGLAEALVERAAF